MNKRDMTKGTVPRLDHWSLIVYFLMKGRKQKPRTWTLADREEYRDSGQN